MSTKNNAEIGCINGRIAFTAAGRPRPPRDPISHHFQGEASMLHPRFRRLLEGYELAQDGPPGDLAKAVRALPRVGRLPSPWETRAPPVRRELLEAAVAVDSRAVAAFANGPETRLMERLAAVEPPGQGRVIEGCRTD